MPIYSLDDRRPTLPPEGRYWIAPSATVIGDVVVGQDVGVWFGAVLRGDNELINIGARTNIQESCTLHTDIGFPLDDRRGMHGRPQRDPARLHDRRRLADRHGRDRAQRREDRPRLARRRRRAGDRGQGIPRPFADRRLAAKASDARRRSGRVAPAAGALRRELATLRLRPEPESGEADASLRPRAARTPGRGRAARQRLDAAPALTATGTEPTRPSQGTPRGRRARPSCGRGSGPGDGSGSKYSILPG